MVAIILAEAHAEEDLLKGEDPEKTNLIFLLTPFFINVEHSALHRKPMWFPSEVLFSMYKPRQNQEGKSQWLIFNLFFHPL